MQHTISVLGAEYVKITGDSAPLVRAFTMMCVKNRMGRGRTIQFPLLSWDKHRTPRKRAQFYHTQHALPHIKKPDKFNSRSQSTQRTLHIISLEHSETISVTDIPSV